MHRHPLVGVEHHLRPPAAVVVQLVVVERPEHLVSSCSQHVAAVQRRRPPRPRTLEQVRSAPDACRPGWTSTPRANVYSNRGSITVATLPARPARAVPARGSQDQLPPIGDAAAAIAVRTRLAETGTAVPQGLGEQADPQLLQQPADASDVVRQRTGRGRDRRRRRTRPRAIDHLGPPDPGRGWRAGRSAAARSRAGSAARPPVLGTSGRHEARRRPGRRAARSRLGGSGGDGGGPRHQGQHALPLGHVCGDHGHDGEHPVGVVDADGVAEPPERGPSRTAGSPGSARRPTRAGRRPAEPAPIGYGWAEANLSVLPEVADDPLGRIRAAAAPAGAARGGGRPADGRRSGTVTPTVVPSSIRAG